MRTDHIARLAEIAADVAAIDGGEILRVELGEMADGSRRSFALVDTYSCGLEQQYRVSSPAPDDAPVWARSFTGWELEVRVGDDAWLGLEEDLDEVLA